MATIRSLCEQRYSEEHGITGWLDVRAPSNFDVGFGFGIAHDVLEHFDLSGTVEAEGEAFGAMLWGRGSGGYWQRQYHEQVYSDIAEIVIRGGGCAAPPKRPRALTCDCGEPELMLVEALDRAFRACDEYLDTYSQQDTPRETIKQWFDNFGQWIRIGYRRANRRYGRTTNPHMLSLMYRELETKFDAAVRMCDSELDKIRVDVNLRRSEVSVTVIEYRDPYSDY